ncbi:hypothetical protein HWQ46_23905 [Shewanella sp. D64]|uniref:hypothetical protein n=1 Tax=unclassified Shewanella TaxID=196818 RepID=UPI0022BA6903|nr:MULTISPECIES: hypothetical protein [unclassified Shewanella]MEC4728571.1 hypothetical protein [Shewanella sp. D64]MEC4740505.1 hypothetical protein [Shewanella sp. E94]WBJ94826.1 hypothetical protein HWQ47_23785 [Shewanella sp. MTB7]
MKIIDIFKWILWLPVLAIGALIAFFLQLLEKRIERSFEEVENVLLEMESGVVSEDLWDDFLSVPIFNKQLDKIREKVEVLWAYDDFQTKNDDGYYVLNEKGLSDIREIINELRNT